MTVDYVTINKSKYVTNHKYQERRNYFYGGVSPQHEGIYWRVLAWGRLRSTDLEAAIYQGGKIFKREGNSDKHQARNYNRGQVGGPRCDSAHVTPLWRDSWAKQEVAVMHRVLGKRNSEVPQPRGSSQGIRWGCTETYLEELQDTGGIGWLGRNPGL